MNKFTKVAASVFMFACLSGSGFAQNFKFCATDEMVKKSLESNPGLMQEYLAEEDRLIEIDKEAAKNGYQSEMKEMMLPPVYTIPVVFHILHENGTENISDAQIYDAMRVMNEDYSKTNADYANTIATFQPIAADCEIIFKLAQKDPAGLCTNGIDRIYSAETNIGDDDSKLNPWPRNKYLNVWVVKTISSGAAGYAYLPGTAFPSTVDGIIILSTYIGAIGTGNVSRSHALSHEIGHFLNLRHVWGNSNNPGVDCSGTDNVTDTPPTEGWTTCNLAGATCGSPVDNVQNFMEYSYCSTMFTAGQKTRMRTALLSTTGQRNNLSTSTNLTATGVGLPAVLCQANFESSNVTNTICAGSTLTFTDLSWNGVPTSWTWNFPGGTPSSSGVASPVIQYDTPGIYSVSLSVTNASGTVAVTKTNYITVNPMVATYSVPIYSESFEGSAIPNTEWQVRNFDAGSNTWTQTNTAAMTGIMSAHIINASAYDGHVDELVGPSVDMTLIAGPSPAMTFKVAHAQETSSSIDKLQVYVSTNCGQSWVLRKSLQGASLSTVGVQSASFTPNAGQWVEENVNLSGYATQTNLYFMFRFTSNGGNNIFIDDINILGNVGIEEISNTVNFNVYPNPAEENTIIAFDLLAKQDVDLSVFDVVGRKVSSIFTGELNEGEYEYPVGVKNHLSPGVYFVTLTTGTNTFTKKLIVK